MAIFAFLIFVSIILPLYLAVKIYYEDQKSLANRCFALASLSVAATAFVEFMCYYVESPAIALFWVRMKLVSFLTLPLLLNYILAYTRSKWLHYKSTYLLLYIPFIILVVNHYCFVQLDPVRYSWGYGYHSQYFGMDLFRYICLSIESFLLVFLCYSYSIKATTKNKQQSRYMSFTFLAAILMANLTYAIAGLLKHPLPEFITIYTSIPLYFVLIYLMERYKLFVLNPTTAANNIIATMTDTLLLLDPGRNIVNINPAGLKLLDYHEAELVGHPITIILRDEMTSCNELKQQTTQNNIITNYETGFLTKRGNVVPVSLSISILKDNSGEIAGVVVIARDITTLKQTEEALIQQSKRLSQSNQELQEFTYIASHDLQEPLRKIIAFGDRLKAKCYDSITEQGRDYLDRMQNAAARMQTLINDLLTYSRVTTQTRHIITVDLAQIMKDVISDLEIQIEQTGGVIEFGALPVLEADSTQLRQLLQNLIGNALKFSKPGVPPQVKITSTIIRLDGMDQCELTLADNGIGIEKDYLDRIFGVFQRLHGKDEYPGTGIGLAVCKKITEWHGGSIRVESEAGTGSRFIVRIPVKATIKVDTILGI